MGTRAERLWDKSDRDCIVCGDTYTPVRHSQKFCPPPKRCRYTNKARLLSRNSNPHPLICKDCGKDFMPRASNQYTCGMNCPGRPQRFKKCANAFCSKKFAISRNGSATRQIFCSTSCRNKEEAFRKYKMTSRDYLKMLKAQGGNCLACGEQPEEGRRLVVAHDHSCCPGQYNCGTCIKGLLHIECNILEGLFTDNPNRLVKAATHFMSSIKYR
jgi:hypothetical protein